MVDFMGELDADEVIRTDEDEWFVVKQGQVKIGNRNTIKLTHKGTTVRVIGTIHIEVEPPPNIEIGQENDIQVEGADEADGPQSQVEITGDIHIIAVARIERV